MHSKLLFQFERKEQILHPLLVVVGATELTTAEDGQLGQHRNLVGLPISSIKWAFLCIFRSKS